MSNDLIYIYDHTTGKEITRELTDAEQAQRDAQVAEALIFQKQKWWMTKKYSNRILEHVLE